MKTKAWQAVLDRIEGRMAVLAVDDQELAIPASLLPSDAKEGDLLIGSLRVDRRRTEQARADLSARIRRLTQRSD